MSNISWCRASSCSVRTLTWSLFFIAWMLASIQRLKYSPSDSVRVRFCLRSSLTCFLYLVISWNNLLSPNKLHLLHHTLLVPSVYCAWVSSFRRQKGHFISLILHPFVPPYITVQVLLWWLYLLFLETCGNSFRAMPKRFYHSNRIRAVHPTTAIRSFVVCLTICQNDCLATIA